MPFQQGADGKLKMFGPGGNAGKLVLAKAGDPCCCAPVPCFISGGCIASIPTLTVVWSGATGASAKFNGTYSLTPELSNRGWGAPFEGSENEGTLAGVFVLCLSSPSPAINGLWDIAIGDGSVRNQDIFSKGSGSCDPSGTYTGKNSQGDTIVCTISH